MHFPTVLHVLGRLLLLFGTLMLVPFIIAMVYEYRNPTAHEPLAFGVAIATSLVLGALATWRFKPDYDRFGHREGFAIVGSGWVVASAIGAIPYCLMGDLGMSYTDAFFETMSGLTTTGASIMGGEGAPMIEDYGRGILFWRSYTQWLGGMGIVVLTVALLPNLGAGGYQMLKAEVPGPTAEKIAPRIAQTAKYLWAMYCALTLMQILLLWAPSWFVSAAVVAEPHTPYMDLYEATTHSFSTLATGGFSTRSASMAAFTPYHQWVVIVFMFLAGMNFTIHIHVLLGRFRMLNNSELRFYTLVAVIATVVMFLFLSFATFPDKTKNPHHYGLELEPPPVQPSASGPEADQQTQPGRLPVFDHSDEFPPGMSRATFHEQEHPEDNPPPDMHHGHVEAAARHATFQSLSLMTSTGYATADYDGWPPFCKILLVLLMFFGGCAGSTGGGFKQFRVLLLIRFAWRELKQLVQPRQVLHVKFDGHPVDDKVIRGILGVFVLYFGLTIAGALALSTLEHVDVDSAATCAVSTIGNVGPGLHGIGPTLNYAWIPDVGKWICSALMLLGRLEIYSVLVLMLPSLYRR